MRVKLESVVIAFPTFKNSIGGSETELAHEK